MTKTKYWLSLLAISVVLVAGSLAVSPIAIADDEDDDGDDDDDNDNDKTPVRDNVNVLQMTLTDQQAMVIIDNAGIGGTSDVEVTWKFNPDNCVLLAAGSDGSSVIAVVALGNDGALTIPLLPLPSAVPVAHNDVKNLEALLLTAKGGEVCEIDPNEGEFVSVSTIALSGPGLLDVSHTPGLP